MSKNKAIDIKVECQSVKQGAPLSLGMMVELTAPEATAAPILRPAQGIVFVVDRSGSMGDGRLEMVKNTMLDTLGRVSKDDFLSIVVFDHDAQVLVPMTRVGAMDLKAVRRTITELSTRGNTNLESGYRLGLAQAAKVPTGVNVTVLLLSDGQANDGLTDPDALRQIAAGATEHLITTSTLGIGEAYDERILVELANGGVGNHFAAVHQEEAAFGLEQELDGLLERTVSDLKIVIYIETVNAQQIKTRSLTPARAMHRDNTISIFDFADLGSLEERNYVFEASLPDFAVPAGQFLSFRVEVSFTNLTTGQREHAVEHFQVAVVAAEEWVEPARNEDIVMELANLRAQDSKQRAIELMRHGRVAEAQELLRAAGSSLEDLEMNSMFMSDRNRNRARMARDEFFELASMSGDEFIKRGEESLKRGRENKPDPRKRDQGSL